MSFAAPNHAFEKAKDPDSLIDEKLKDSSCF
jgi:hypothetical protein